MATKKVGFKCSKTLMSGTHHEDVGNSIQDDKDSFAILWRQQTEKRLKHIGLNEVDHLLDRASTGEVCNSPDSFFLSFVVTLRGRRGEEEKWITDGTRQARWIGEGRMGMRGIPAQACQPGKEQGLRWWPPGSGSPSPLWCWTGSMLPPFEYWLFCGTAAGETWSGPQHPAQPESAHQYQSLYFQWHEVQGSKERQKAVALEWWQCTRLYKVDIVIGSGWL